MARSKSGIPNVVRKGLKYWFQVKVPKDIADTLGKSNWQTNLQTSDLRLAKKRAKAAAQEAREIFAKARLLDLISADVRHVKLPFTGWPKRSENQQCETKARFEGDTASTQPVVPGSGW